jgi:hypothetical protein
MKSVLKHFERELWLKSVGRGNPVLTKEAGDAMRFDSPEDAGRFRYQMHPTISVMFDVVPHVARGKEQG